MVVAQNQCYMWQTIWVMRNIAFNNKLQHLLTLKDLYFKNRFKIDGEIAENNAILFDHF